MLPVNVGSVNAPVKGVPPTGMLLYSTLMMWGPTSSGKNSAKNPLFTLPVTWKRNKTIFSNFS